MSSETSQLLLAKLLHQEFGVFIKELTSKERDMTLMTVSVKSAHEQTREKIALAEQNSAAAADARACIQTHAAKLLYLT
jgi:hypothetical protein